MVSFVFSTLTLAPFVHACQINICKSTKSPFLFWRLTWYGAGLFWVLGDLNCHFCLLKHGSVSLIIFWYLIAENKIDGTFVKVSSWLQLQGALTFSVLKVAFMIYHKTIINLSLFLFWYITFSSVTLPLKMILFYIFIQSKQKQLI